MAVAVTSVAHSVLPGSTPGKTLRLEAKRSRQRPDRMLTRGPSLWGLCWNQNHGSWKISEHTSETGPAG